MNKSCMKPTQIKMNDCNFFVNEQTRTVVCICEGTKYMAQDFLNHYNEKHDTSGRYDLYRGITGCYMPDYFKGIARCSIHDQWDEKIGAQIAFARMKRKMDRAWVRALNVFFESEFNWLNQVADIADRACSRVANEEESLRRNIENKIGKEPE